MTIQPKIAQKCFRVFIGRGDLSIKGNNLLCFSIFSLKALRERNFHDFARSGLCLLKQIFFLFRFVAHVGTKFTVLWKASRFFCFPFVLHFLRRTRQWKKCVWNYLSSSITGIPIQERVKNRFCAGEGGKTDWNSFFVANFITDVYYAFLRGETPRSCFCSWPDFKTKMTEDGLQHSVFEKNGVVFCSFCSR